MSSVPPTNTKPLTAKVAAGFARKAGKTAVHRVGDHVALHDCLGHYFGVVVAVGPRWIKVQRCRSRVIGQDTHGHYGNMIVKGDFAAPIDGKFEEFTWRTARACYGDKYGVTVHANDDNAIYIRRP